MRRRSFAVIVAVSLSCSVALAGVPAEKEVNLFEQIELRHIGPEGNRASAVAGAPGARARFAGSTHGGQHGHRRRRVSFSRWPLPKDRSREYRDSRSV